MVKKEFEMVSDAELADLPEMYKVPAKGNLDFVKLVQAQMWDFRSDEKLRKRIEKAFCNVLAQEEGLSLYQSVEIRKNAYCLLYGISPQNMHKTYMKDYGFVLKRAQKRAEDHNRDPNECPCKAGKLVFDLCKVQK